MKLKAICVLLAGLMVTAVGCDSFSSKQPGMVVIYEIDEEQYSGDKPSGKDMEMLLEAIIKRLVPNGRTEGSVRLLDDNRIEVTIYRKDLKEMQRVADLLVKPGTLEFRVLANSVDHADLIALAKESKGDMVYQADEKKKGEKKLVARWIPVQNEREEEFAPYRDIATRRKDVAGKSTLQILVVIDPFNVTGEYIVNCSTGLDDTMQPCVNFKFSTSGGHLFGGLTTENCPDEVGNFKRHLGIILDGYLYSAPFINSPITTNGQITGEFTRQEVEDMATLLGTGSLPIPIRKVEQRVVNMEGQESP